MEPVEKWSEEDIRETTKNLLENKTCDSCKHKFNCPIFGNKYNTCSVYEYSNFDDILRVVRMGYPNSIKSDIVQEYPMEKTSNSIYKINTTYTNEG